MPVTAPGWGRTSARARSSSFRARRAQVHHDRSGVCRAHALTGALEQEHAEFLLQSADLPGHRGLHQMQQLRGTRDAADLGHRDERLELSDVHGHPSGAIRTRHRAIMA
jgi:hypothetical protein